MINRLCVFCGSSTGNKSIYQEVAAQLGSQLASSGVALVYGGGRVGLMGILADSVLHRRGEAIGVMPRALVEKEIAHPNLSKLHVVETMHERKALMADLADAFVLLPGGFGSWEEFCEVVTWLQLGMHRKPCGILNVAGTTTSYWRRQPARSKRDFSHRSTKIWSLCKTTSINFCPS